MPSLASSTGTRVDSAAKHTLQCKVAEPLLREWAKMNDPNFPDRYIQQNKMVYCVHKNELAMNVATAMMPNGTKSLVQTYKQNHAYPPIVSTVGCLSVPAQNKLRQLYSAVFFQEFSGYLRDLEAYSNNPARQTNEEEKRVNNSILNLPYFMPMGYALTFGHPHHMLGDTVCTLLIGGMITVRNGAFEMRTGQMVQWYFDFEETSFAANTSEEYAAGERVLFREGDPPSLASTGPEYKLLAAPGNVKDDRYDRKSYKDTEYYAPSNGKRQRMDENARDTTDKSRMVFRIKPYVKSKRTATGDVYGDKIRVFAKCIGGGRAFDDVDIMLMTQSM